jgi:hypothetical protein
VITEIEQTTKRNEVSKKAKAGYRKNGQMPITEFLETFASSLRYQTTPSPTLQTTDRAVTISNVPIEAGIEIHVSEDPTIITTTQTTASDFNSVFTNFYDEYEFEVRENKKGNYKSKIVSVLPKMECNYDTCQLGKCLPDGTCHCKKPAFGLYCDRIDECLILKCVHVSKNEEKIILLLIFELNMANLLL